MSKSFRKIFFLALLLTICNVSYAKEKENFKKVISIGGSLTEIIYALNAEDLLVAIDTTSTFPKAAMELLPNVGYMRSLAAEPILSLNPDLIIATNDAGPPQVLEQLREAGTKVVIVDDEPSISGIIKKIEKVASVLNLEEEGRVLGHSLAVKFQQVEQLIGKSTKDSKVLFLMSVGVGAPMAAGSETSADSMIRLAGATNAMSHMTGYKTASPESIVAAAPEIILVPQRAFDHYGSIDAVFALPELIATPAAQEKRLLVFDDLYLTGFGPRTVDAILDLAEGIDELSGRAEHELTES